MAAPTGPKKVHRYTVVAAALLIQVIQVTPHDYRRP